MKRLFKVLMLMVFIIPLSVKASMFDIPGTDIIIQIDEDIWRVLTRDDITNKELLEEYELDYTTINDLFLNNDIYMNALTYLDDNAIELFVRKTTNDSYAYLSDLSDVEKESLAYQLASDSQAELYDFFANQSSVYIYYEFFENNLYVANYFTTFNGNDYSFTFQSTIEIDDEMREVYDEIIDGITLDESLTKVEKEKDNSLPNAILLTLIFIPVALIVGLGIKKQIKKNNK